MESHNCSTISNILSVIFSYNIIFGLKLLHDNNYPKISLTSLWRDYNIPLRFSHMYIYLKRSFFTHVYVSARIQETIFVVVAQGSEKYILSSSCTGPFARHIIVTYVSNARRHILLLL